LLAKLQLLFKGGQAELASNVRPVKSYM